MKKLIFLLVVLGSFALSAFAESYRRTTADMYKESYRAAMRRQTGSSAAEIHAEEYRSRYEICDEHHNCASVTGGRVERPVKTQRKRDEAESLKPFVDVPIWL